MACCRHKIATSANAKSLSSRNDFKHPSSLSPACTPNVSPFTVHRTHTKSPFGSQTLEPLNIYIRPTAGSNWKLQFSRHLNRHKRVPDTLKKQTHLVEVLPGLHPPPVEPGEPLVCLYRIYVVRFRAQSLPSKGTDSRPASASSLGDVESLVPYESPSAREWRSVSAQSANFLASFFSSIYNHAREM